MHYEYITPDYISNVHETPLGLVGGGEEEGGGGGGEEGGGEEGGGGVE